MEVQLDHLVAIYLALLLFGLAYNALVERLEREVPDHGYTSFLVSGGVLVTIMGASILIGWQSALLVLICFTASGLPMIIGSMSRWLHQRRIDRTLNIRDMIQVLKEADDT